MTTPTTPRHMISITLDTLPVIGERVVVNHHGWAWEATVVAVHPAEALQSHGPDAQRVILDVDGVGRDEWLVTR